MSNLSTSTTAAMTTWTTEYRHLFALHPENTFIVKLAYWLSR